MAASAIEWTDATWNPVTGCDRVSAGCDHCYALTLAGRLKTMGQPKYQRDGDPKTSGPGFGLSLHADVLAQPLRWRKPRFVFVNSMSDLFHPEVPDDFIWAVFGTMAAAPQHAFQVLTKRPRRMASLLKAWEAGLEATPSMARLPLVNVWMGTSIEDDAYTFRADHLRATPAAVRFLSLEPLLGPVPSLDLTGIDWLIVGGESGNGARRMELEWVRNVRDQCAKGGTALFVKQLGSVWSGENGHGRSHGSDCSVWPTDLRVRQMPRAPQAESLSIWDHVSGRVS
jgi:protein gp37